LFAPPWPPAIAPASPTPSCAPAWAPRRHFCDPSLAAAALGGSPDRLLKDLEWFGLLYESLVIRDLRVLAQALDGEVLHYRDDYGVEVDTIVQLRDGRWGAIEIKLGPPLQRLPRPFSCKRHWLVPEVETVRSSG
jgi:hypothetical protein